nr:hypothetical protein [Mesorhizobium sp. LNHC221B00]
MAEAWKPCVCEPSASGLCRRTVLLIYVADCRTQSIRRGAAEDLPGANREASLQRCCGTFLVASFRACRCREYARVDLRIDRSGQSLSWRSTPMAGLGMSSAYVSDATTSDTASRAWSIASSMSLTRFGIGIPKAEHASNGTGFFRANDR